MEGNDDVKEGPERISGHEPEIPPESGENMDFEDSQDSVWTQSTSNTVYDSHRQDPDHESADSGKFTYNSMNF